MRLRIENKSNRNLEAKEASLQNAFTIMCLVNREGNFFLKFQQLLKTRPMLIFNFTRPHAITYTKNLVWNELITVN